MTTRANQLAVRAVLALSGLIAVLLGMRFIVSHWPEGGFPMTIRIQTVQEPPRPMPARPQPTPRVVYVERPVPQRMPPPAVTPAAATPRPAWANSQSRIVAASATPAAKAPPAGPERVRVAVSRERWSRAVEIPQGRMASVTFSIGRMRVERNGADAGVLFRNPTLEAGGRSGQVVASLKLAPLASLDRAPRTVKFDALTRTLRFQSLEAQPEDVVVDIH